MDKGTRKAIVIVGLIVNIAVLPGIGTLAIGKFVSGTIQLFSLMIIAGLEFLFWGDLKTMMLLLIPAILIWIWAIMSTVLELRKVIRESTDESMN